MKSAATPDEMLAPLIRNYLLRELGKLTSYIDNNCQGDSPAKEHARHIAEGRKVQVEKMLDDPDFRLAAKPADEGIREAAIRECATVAREQRCERGTPWDAACTTIAEKISALSHTGAPKP